MSLRTPRFFVILIAMAALLIVGSLRADEGKILRFKNAAKVRVEGKDHLVVIADEPKGAHPLRLVIPNKDEDGKFDPIADRAEVVKHLQPGDLVEAAWETHEQVNLLSSIARYAPKPGELAPHGYVFVGRELAKENSADLTIILRKLGQTTRATISAHSDSSGQPQPDPVLTAVVAKLSDGNSVWAELSDDKEPRLLVLMPYAEPQRGKLLKVEPIDIDGQKGISVEIIFANATVTAVIPGSMENGTWKSDARLLSSVRRCKPGNDVLFRVQEVDDKKWLREIDAVPQPVASRPTPPRGGSNTDANGLPHPRIPGGGTPGVGGVGF